MDTLDLTFVHRMVMPPERGYKIRTMTRAEVDIAVDWAALEGWNPCVHEADCLYRAYPQGFFVGLLDGEPIACIWAVSDGESVRLSGVSISSNQNIGSAGTAFDCGRKR